MPVLMMLIMGIVYYGVFMALGQALTLAAQEGARAALRYPASGAADPTLAMRVSAAAQVAQSTLPASVWALVSNKSTVAASVACAGPVGTSCISVTLTMPSSSILPMLPFLPVPSTLSGWAMAQIASDT